MMLQPDNKVHMRVSLPGACSVRVIQLSPHSFSLLKVHLSIGAEQYLGYCAVDTWEFIWFSVRHHAQFATTICSSCESLFYCCQQFLPDEVEATYPSSTSICSSVWLLCCCACSVGRCTIKKTGDSILKPALSSQYPPFEGRDPLRSCTGSTSMCSMQAAAFLSKLKCLC